MEIQDMNEFWIEKYLRRIGTKERRIFIWVFIVSTLVHAFVMTNNLANYDSMWFFHGPQDTVTSGRWFLTYAGGNQFIFSDANAYWGVERFVYFHNSYFYCLSFRNRQYSFGSAGRINIGSVSYSSADF